MRISFDLDETLICSDPKVPKEPDILAWLLKPFFPEPLRFGAIALIKELNSRGYKIWVYTSSGRSARYVRMWLSLYGIKIEGVVNKEIHNRAVESGLCPSLVSKYPPAFGINIHIDDSEGVKREGKEYNFNVIHLSPNDMSWVATVLEQVDKLAKNKS